MGNTQKLPPVVVSRTVLDAINEELAYQSTLPGSGRADARDHGVEGQLVTLSVYLRKAEEAWTFQAGDDAALENIRKIAGTAIRALEMYGCPRRKVKDE